MYKVCFWYVNENERYVLLFETQMPFIPEIGKEMYFSLDNERHYAEIDSIEYVFDDSNKFSHINARIGRF